MNCGNITIAAVGDVMLGVSSMKAIAQKITIPDLLAHDISIIQHDVIQLLSKNDIVFGNLETVISKDFFYHNYDNPQLLMAPVKAVNVLKSAGFNIMTIANNHIIDHGLKLVKETVALLKASNIEYIGIPSELHDGEHKFVTFNLNDGLKKVGFIGFNLCNNGEQVTTETIKRAIEQNRSNVDILCVALHWGNVNMPVPSHEQVNLAHKLIDSGADILIGSHPHVLQPVEIYNKRIIAYSLGNFVFDMESLGNTESAILEITINNNGDFTPRLEPIIIRGFKVFKDLNRQEELANKITCDINSYVQKRCSKSSRYIKYSRLLNILKVYLFNIHRYSAKFHYNTWKRWLRKLLS